MNYRLILTEMLFDYIELRDKTYNPVEYDVYKKVCKDIQLILEIEPNELSILEEAKDILNNNQQ